MKLVLLFGDAAVGKMTVGQELTKITDLRLFHNLAGSPLLALSASILLAYLGNLIVFSILGISFVGFISLLKDGYFLNNHL